MRWIFLLTLLLLHNAVAQEAEVDFRTCVDQHIKRTSELTDRFPIMSLQDSLVQLLVEERHAHEEICLEYVSCASLGEPANSMLFQQCLDNLELDSDCD